MERQDGEASVATLSRTHEAAREAYVADDPPALESQLRLDLTQPDRSADMINRALTEVEVGIVRRAVLVQIMLDGRSFVGDDGLTTLSVSQRGAADWIARHLTFVTSCDPSSIRKAWQYWQDQGVLLVLPGKRSTTVKIHWQRLRDWHELQSAEQPIFAPLGGVPVVNGGDRRGTAVNGGDRRGTVVNGGDRRGTVVNGGERVNSIDKERVISPSIDSTPSPSTSAAVVTSLAHLPDPPAIAFATSEDADVIRSLSAFWVEHCLEDKHGSDAEATWVALVGLVFQARIRIAQNGGDSLGYYHRAKHKVAPFIAGIGRKKLEAVKQASDVQAEHDAAREQKRDEDAQHDREIEERKRRFGPVADEMNCDAWLELLPPFYARLFAKYRAERGDEYARDAVRLMLLKTLADREAETVTA